MAVVASVLSSLLKTYSRIAPTERGTFRLVRAAREAMPREQWNAERVTPDGFHLKLDLGTYPDCSMAFGLYELDTYRTMRRILKLGMHFVDCGANLGYFTLLAAKWVGPNGRVDAFEPDPINRQRLVEHLKINQLDRQVHIHPVAVGRSAGTVEIFHPRVAGSNHGMASIFSKIAGADEKYDVPVVRVDEALRQIPDLIKIDIEGAELAAIGGMERMLASDRPPRLIIEHNPDSSAAAGYKPSDLHRLLTKFQPKYRIYYIDWRLKRVDTPQELDEITRHGNLLVQCDDEAPKSAR